MRKLWKNARKMSEIFGDMATCQKTMGANYGIEMKNEQNPCFSFFKMVCGGLFDGGDDSNEGFIIR